MKLVLKTKVSKGVDQLYLIRLPNYFDLHTADKLIEKVKKEKLKGKKIVSHLFYNDNMPCIEERDQLELRGKITTPVIELTLED